MTQGKTQGQKEKDKHNAAYAAQVISCAQQTPSHSGLRTFEPVSKYNYSTHNHGHKAQLLHP